MSLPARSTPSIWFIVLITSSYECYRSKHALIIRSKAIASRDDSEKCSQVRWPFVPVFFFFVNISSAHDTKSTSMVIWIVPHLKSVIVEQTVCAWHTACRIYIFTFSSCLLSSIHFVAFFFCFALLVTFRLVCFLWSVLPLQRHMPEYCSEHSIVCRGCVQFEWYRCHFKHFGLSSTPWAVNDLFK